MALAAIRHVVVVFLSRFFSFLIVLGWWGVLSNVLLYRRRKNSAGVEVEDDHEQMAEEPVSKKAKRN